MDFVEHLAQQGVPVARPVKSKAGPFAERVPTELGVFNAVLLEEAPGREIELGDMDDVTIRSWGRLMADLHNASAGVDGTPRPSWRDHLTFAQCLIEPDEVAARSELDFVRSAFDSLDVDSSLHLIHFDLEPDNMHWHDGRPVVFDFDDCARYPFAADVAFALRHIYDDSVQGIDLADRRLNIFLKGYRSRRPLPASELCLFPLFVRVHNLYWFARLKRSIGNGEIIGEESWTADLRSKMVAKMDGYREGFENHPVSMYL